MDFYITTFQAITLSIAVIGAVLGIINTWHNLDKTRVKLKVTPTHAIPIGGLDPSLQFCLDITNLSSFPVTIYDTGCFYHGTDKRASIVTPVLTDGGDWPKRLEPRSSVSVLSQLPRSKPGHKIKCCYAKTQCGVVVTGNSAALQQIANETFS